MEKLISLLKKAFGSVGRVSFSQYGEDLIINGIFDTIGISHPRYIDIGAHHPTLLNNTYFFYRRGSSGVCIEPDKKLLKKIQEKRSRDLCLNCGVGPETKENAPYYKMTAQTLNTFSKESAEKNIEAQDVYGTQSIEEVSYIRIVSINEILKKCKATDLDLLSIDTEGFDEAIITAMNFDIYRPKVICIETIEQVTDNKFKKNNSIIKHLEGL